VEAFYAGSAYPSANLGNVGNYQPPAFSILTLPGMLPARRDIRNDLPREAPFVLYIERRRYFMVDESSNGDTRVRLAALLAADNRCHNWYQLALDGCTREYTLL